MINKLRYINLEMADFCEGELIDRLICDDFVMDKYDPVPNMSLLAKDGCHLSRRGIVAMENALFDHLNINFFAE